MSTVDSFDKDHRINGLIAGVRVVLRIAESVSEGEPQAPPFRSADGTCNHAACVLLAIQVDHQPTEACPGCLDRIEGEACLTLAC